SRLLAALPGPAVDHHFSIRPRHRRSGRTAGRARCQPSGPRRRPPTVWPRPAADRAVPRFHRQPGARRSRSIVLLPYAGLRALSLAPAELAAAGIRGARILLVDRHSERGPGGRAGGRVLGPRRQGVLPARAFAAVVLGRSGADPHLLGDA